MLAQPALRPEFEFGTSDAEVRVVDDTLELTTYDTTGVVTASFVVRSDTDYMRLDANFSDGVYLRIESLGKKVVVESNNLESVVQRMRMRPPPHGRAKDWPPCALGILAIVRSCAVAKISLGRFNEWSAQLMDEKRRSVSAAS